MWHSGHQPIGDGGPGTDNNNAHVLVRLPPTCCLPTGYSVRSSVRGHRRVSEPRTQVHSRGSHAHPIGQLQLLPRGAGPRATTSCFYRARHVRAAMTRGPVQTGTLDCLVRVAFVQRATWRWTHNPANLHTFPIQSTSLAVPIFKIVKTLVFQCPEDKFFNSLKSQFFLVWFIKISRHPFISTTSKTTANPFIWIYKV